MTTKSRKGVRPFQLKILSYGNNYYIERIPRLEAALARRPRRLQLDMIGEGEIPADTALLICSLLRQRSPRTVLVTNAQSSLQGGSVLVWLAGDIRLMRPDGRMFFRHSDEFDEAGAPAKKGWQDSHSKYSDSSTADDADETDYAAVLGVINEFLPVKELAGHPIRLPVLQRFGLVNNEKTGPLPGQRLWPAERRRRQPQCWQDKSSLSRSQEHAARTGKRVESNRKQL